MANLPEVCPWNSFATPSGEKAFLPREGLDGPKLIEWMTMMQEEFSARFTGSPIKPAKRRGLLRNVAVALGNWGAPEAVPALAIALNDEEPLMRGHAAWALGRIRTEALRQALRGRAEGEPDAWARGGDRIGARRSLMSNNDCGGVAGVGNRGNCGGGENRVAHVGPHGKPAEPARESVCYLTSVFRGG